MLIETYKIDAYAFKLDVANPNDVKEIFEQIAHDIGEVDVLVNNAGYGFLKRQSKRMYMKQKPCLM